MTQTEVRSRIRRHRHSFKCEYKQHETALSNFIWNKRLNRNEDGEITEPDIKWDILKKCNLYKPGQKSCDLCLSEKMFIILNQKSPKCINKKSDISNKCIHTKAYFYSELKDKSELNNNVDVIIWKVTGRGLGPANLTPAPNSLEPWLFADDIKISPHRVHRCSQIPTTKCTATMRIRGHLTPPKRAVPYGSNPGNGNKVNLYLSEYFTWALIPNNSTYTYRHTYTQTDRRNQNMI